MTEISLLLLAENESPVAALRPLLERMQYRITLRSPAEEFSSESTPDALIVDLCGESPLSFARLRSDYPALPLLIVTEKEKEVWRDPLTVHTSLYQLRNHFLEALAHLLEARGLALRLSGALESIVGDSHQMIALREEIIAAARSEEPVLIFGEVGSGKELVAQAIGTLRDPWVVFDCQAHLPEKMELELLGCIRGQMAGATSDRIGAIEESGEGTLLIDEVELLPLDLQAKLVRAIRLKEYRPIGAAHPRKIRSRCIATTRIDLGSAVAKGSFRQDLFSLLSTVALSIPPLRQRKGDIPRLAHHLLQRYSRMKEPTPPWSTEAIALLSADPFPGNVAELDSLARKAAALHPYGPISTQTLLQLMEKQSLSIHTAPWNSFDDAQFQSWMRDQERAWLLHQLRHQQGSVSRTAQRLGIGRTALHQRMRTLDIEAAPLRSTRKEEPSPILNKEKRDASR